MSSGRTRRDEGRRGGGGGPRRDEGRRGGGRRDRFEPNSLTNVANMKDFFI